MCGGVRQTGKYKQHIVQSTDFSIKLTSKEKENQSCNTKRNEISILKANYIGMKNYTRSDTNYQAYIS